MICTAILCGMITSVIASAVSVFSHIGLYLSIIPMDNLWTEEKFLEHSVWATGWCKERQLSNCADNQLWLSPAQKEGAMAHWLKGRGKLSMGLIIIGIKSII